MQKKVFLALYLQYYLGVMGDQFKSFSFSKEVSGVLYCRIFRILEKITKWGKEVRKRNISVCRFFSEDQLVLHVIEVDYIQGQVVSSVTSNNVFIKGDCL